MANHDETDQTNDQDVAAPAGGGFKPSNVLSMVKEMMQMIKDVTKIINEVRGGAGSFPSLSDSPVKGLGSKLDGLPSKNTMQPVSPEASSSPSKGPTLGGM